MTDRQPKHETMVDQELEWHDACVIDDVAPGSGLAVVVQDEQIAIVRTQSDLFAALSNFDPFSKAFVIARGIVGERAGVPRIASPIYRQSFCLETGECLEDRTIRLAVFPIRVLGGRIQVALNSSTRSA